MALGAHLIWGLLPLYLQLVRHVPALEFVGWRVLFSIPVCLLILLLRRQLGELRAAFADWRMLRALLVTAVCIAINWVVYVQAINAGHIYAASFGYYIAPLMQVLAGTVLLGERLSRRQWLAVALAGFGVLLLGWGELEVVWISLALALSWSTYGLIRKVTPIGSLPGLTVETLVLAPFAAGLVAWYAAGPHGVSFGHDPSLSLLIACAGVLTAAPLLLFAIAARRMDFTLLGMLQFLSPTIVFVLGATVFGRPLDGWHIAAFVIIWIAIALFVADLYALLRTVKA
jgi:chloramphenicol-sensitive protein RarD